MTLRNEAVAVSDDLREKVAMAIDPGPWNPVIDEFIATCDEPFDQELMRRNREGAREKLRSLATAAIAAVRAWDAAQPDDGDHDGTPAVLEYARKIYEKTGGATPELKRAYAAYLRNQRLAAPDAAQKENEGG